MILKKLWWNDRHLAIVTDLQKHQLCAHLSRELVREEFLVTRNVNKQCLLDLPTHPPTPPLTHTHSLFRNQNVTDRHENSIPPPHSPVPDPLPQTQFCRVYNYRILFFSQKHTVFDLITTHTPISAQSKNSVVFRLQPVYFFLYFFTKAYVVGTHLNCIDKSMQFKWVPTTYVFVKKVRKICIVIIK